MTPVWAAGLDAASPTTSAADHLAHEVAAALADVPDLVVTTHLVPAPGGFSSHLALALTAARPRVPRGWQDAVLQAALGASAAHDVAEIGLVALEAGAEVLAQGLPGLLAGARHAASHAAGGTDGRAVRYPGCDTVGERVTVGRLLTTTAIDDVHVLGGGPPPGADTVVVTRGHVRPRMLDGRLVLQVQPAAGGTLVPFENPHPTPCCADH